MLPSPNYPGILQIERNFLPLSAIFPSAMGNYSRVLKRIYPISSFARLKKSTPVKTFRTFLTSYTT